jgi:hypothetical protein
MLETGYIGDNHCYYGTKEKDETADGATFREKLKGVPGVSSTRVEGSCFHKNFCER